MKYKSFNNKANVIGNNLRKYRELRGLSLRALSDKLALLGLKIYHSELSLGWRSKHYL